MSAWVVLGAGSGCENARALTDEGIVKARPQRRFLSPTAIGVLGTLLVHALVLQSALLGSRAHKIRVLEVQGPGAALIKSDAVPAETLILIELPKIGPVNFED